MRIEKVNNDEIAVIGDGDSDRRSAQELNCLFVSVTADGFTFENVENMLKAYQPQ